jgi:hypothetical protein
MGIGNMKKLFLFMAVMICAWSTRAQITNGYIVPAEGLNTIVYTNGFVSTNITGGIYSYTNIFYTGSALYHTFEAGANTVGTNTCTGSLDTTCDNTNWLTFINAATLTNTGPYRSNYTGKILWARWRITNGGTNASTFWNYMGQ